MNVHKRKCEKDGTSVPPLRDQRGLAYIVDNRGQGVERVAALGRTVPEAEHTAFAAAAEHCELYNAREGWARFVPVTARAWRARGW